MALSDEKGLLDTRKDELCAKGGQCVKAVGFVRAVGVTTVGFGELLGTLGGDDVQGVVVKGQLCARGGLCGRAVGFAKAVGGTTAGFGKVLGKKGGDDVQDVIVKGVLCAKGGQCVKAEGVVKADGVKTECVGKKVRASRAATTCKTSARRASCPPRAAIASWRSSWEATTWGASSLKQ